MKITQKGIPQRGIIQSEKSPLRAFSMRRVLTNEQEAAVAAEYAGGLSTPKLSAKWGVTLMVINNALRRQGCKRRSFAESNGPTLREANLKKRARCQRQDADILRLYASGLSMRDVARSTGVSFSYVQTFLTGVEGVARPQETPRKYALDESAFDDAENNPEAAYHVGFLMADGCVSARPPGNGQPAIVLGLSRQDEGQLENFRRFLGSSAPIRRYSMKTNYSSSVKDYSHFSVRSDRLAIALLRYGVMPRKTMTAEVCSLEKNPHFWCGAVCGDGWVFVNKQGLFFLGFMGSKQLVTQFRDYCEGIAGKRYTPQAVGKVWTMVSTGRRAKLIAKTLFENCPFALERKRLIVEKEAIAPGDGRKR